MGGKGSWPLLNNKLFDGLFTASDSSDSNESFLYNIKEEEKK